jgi:hypothetical protein
MGKTPFKILPILRQISEAVISHTLYCGKGETSGNEDIYNRYSLGRTMVSEYLEAIRNPA